MAPASRTVSTAAIGMLVALAAGTLRAPGPCREGCALRCLPWRQGSAPDPTMPVIWGQHQAYLYRQISEYKLGSRKNERNAFAHPAHTARGDGGARRAFLAEALAQAKPAARLGGRDQARPAAIVTGQCVACHGILGMGDGTNPRIAGQSRGYMLKTLQEFQSKARGNNPWMSDILGPLHPDDLVALAAFMAGR